MDEAGEHGPGGEEGYEAHGQEGGGFAKEEAKEQNDDAFGSGHEASSSIDAEGLAAGAEVADGLGGGEGEDEEGHEDSEVSGVGVYGEGVDGEAEVEGSFAEAVHEGVEHGAEGGCFVGEAGEGTIEEVKGAAEEEYDSAVAEVSDGDYDGGEAGDEEAEDGDAVGGEAQLLEAPGTGVFDVAEGQVSEAIAEGLHFLPLVMGLGYRDSCIVISGCGLGSTLSRAFAGAGCSLSTSRRGLRNCWMGHTFHRDHPHLNLPPSRGKRFLRPSRRVMQNPPFCLAATQITLTSILSQDGRGGKRGRR